MIVKNIEKKSNNKIRDKKKILFLTGTRADFGKLKPLMRKVEDAPDFDCQIFCTGMHTLSRYSYTHDEIRKSGFKEIFLYINQIESNNAEMDLVLANTVQGFGYYVREYKPDLIVVHGDRIEALAGAIVGMLNNILVAHIEGGELSGTVDELIRHSVSKLSHLHFVANNEARNRLIQMGEASELIFVIGSPEVDVMLSDGLPTLTTAKRRYGIRFKEYAIFSYHPVTTELHNLQQNTNDVVDALEASNLNFLVLYPNNDRGSDIILQRLAKLKNNKRFKIFPSVRFEYFLTLLKYCKAIVGNSSAGVREAPVYGTFTINIGNRQKNRFHYSSIINIPEDKEKILEALRNFPKVAKPSLHFGKGNSAELFIDRLRRSNLWSTPYQKQFRDYELSKNIRTITKSR